MKASNMIGPDRFDIEAREYCERHAPSATPAHIEGLAASLRQKAFMEECQPFLKLKVEVYQRTVPTILICEDEPRVETVWKFTEAEQTLLAECDRQIQEIALRYQSAQRRSAEPPT